MGNKTLIDMVNDIDIKAVLNDNSFNGYDINELRRSISSGLKLDNISFLIGNGCSIYAGSQSTLNFKWDQLTIQGIDDVIVNKYKSYLINLGIEDLLNNLISIKKYNIIMQNSYEVSELDKLISLIKKELLNNYVNSINYNNVKYHMTLFRKLRNLKILDKVKIYTTNYDMILEYCLDSLKISYSNGFKGFINRRFDFKSISMYDNLKLIKLHGSINWIKGENMFDIKEIQPQFINGKINIINQDQALIYPTQDKLGDTFNYPYSELMRHMLDNLSNYKNYLFILGYRYADVHINDIIEKALVNPNLKIVIFNYDYDSSNDFYSKIKNLSSEDNRIFIYEGNQIGDFCNFVEYFLPTIDEETEEEKIISKLSKVISNVE